MRLLLDEMWRLEIAAQLRRRGHDVIAATEAGYGGLADDVVFERAQQDGRALVTDNVGDFERARVAFERTGRRHHGVICAVAPQFNRNLGAGVIGPLVTALVRLLVEPIGHDPQKRVFYLRRIEWRPHRSLALQPSPEVLGSDWGVIGE